MKQPPRIISLALLILLFAPNVAAYKEGPATVDTRDCLENFEECAQTVCEHGKICLDDLVQADGVITPTVECTGTLIQTQTKVGAAVGQAKILHDLLDIRLVNFEYQKTVTKFDFACSVKLDTYIFGTGGINRIVRITQPAADNAIPSLDGVGPSVDLLSLTDQGRYSCTYTGVPVHNDYCEFTYPQEYTNATGTGTTDPTSTKPEEYGYPKSADICIKGGVKVINEPLGIGRVVDIGIDTAEHTLSKCVSAPIDYTIANLQLERDEVLPSIL